MLLEGMITHPRFHKDILSSFSGRLIPIGGGRELTVDQQTTLLAYVSHVTKLLKRALNLL